MVEFTPIEEFQRKSDHVARRIAELGEEVDAPKRSKRVE